MSGICMRQKNKYDRDALHFAPFVLLPSPFPKDEYYKAIQLQTILNELMHKVKEKLRYIIGSRGSRVSVVGRPRLRLSQGGFEEHDKS